MTARLHLVRHGRAEADYGADPDPGLDDTGRAQAHEMALALESRGPLPVVVSPMRRTRETAEPLLARWGVAPVVDPRVSEIPSPTDDLGERERWLREAMRGTWDVLGERQRAWRADLLGALLAMAEDTVVVTHFIAINVALGHAGGDDALVQAMVGNASCTVLENDGVTLRVVETGGVGPSRVR